MIQDIAPYKFHNEYKPYEPEAQDYILVYEKNTILLNEEQARQNILELPRLHDFSFVSDLNKKVIYLFSIDTMRFYLFLDADLSRLSGYTFAPIRTLRTIMPEHLAFAAVTGYQLSLWYTQSRFCGHCGQPTIHSQKERALLCPKCGQTIYPRLNPAVIVGIVHGDKILLTKYEGREHKRYALIAGYAEIGETIEETVHREVMEEVGLKVKNLTYYKSQPWSFSGTLLFGFYCQLDGDDNITLDREELSCAQWFSREKIPLEGDNISLTKEMITTFKNGEFSF